MSITSVLICMKCAKFAIAGKERRVKMGSIDTALRYHKNCFEQAKPVDSSLYRDYDYGVYSSSKESGNGSHN